MSALLRIGFQQDLGTDPARVSDSDSVQSSIRHSAPVSDEPGRGHRLRQTTRLSDQNEVPMIRRQWRLLRAELLIREIATPGTSSAIGKIGGLPSAETTHTPYRRR